MTDEASFSVIGNRALIFGQQGEQKIYRGINVDDQGRIILGPSGEIIGVVNIRTEPMLGQAPIGVLVTAADTPILAANPNRVGAILVNDSDTDMYLAIGQVAVLNAGIRLNSGGGSLVISRSGAIWSIEAINGIHGAIGNRRIVVQEFA